MSEITAVPLPPVRKGVVSGLTIGLVLAASVAGGIGVWSARAAGSTQPAGKTQQGAAESGEAALEAAKRFMAQNGRKAGVRTTASGLQIKVIREGAGPTPTLNDEVLIGYNGRLTDGHVFDQAERMSFPVAAVVPGFGEGLQAMRKGGQYRLWIPPELGYGAQSPDPNTIPNNAVLIFDVTMIDFRPVRH